MEKKCGAHDRNKISASAVDTPPGTVRANKKRQHKNENVKTAQEKKKWEA